MSLFSAISVSASGMDAQRTRAELLVENLANSETTRTPEGGPYRRKDAVFSTLNTQSPFQSVLQNQMQDETTGVAVSEITVDDSAPELHYIPGHPDADANGNVAFPHMNPAEDMVDLMSASHSYQANIAAISSIKDMIQRSLDILR
jgi:flagellar basal-body rod protein FlgC